MVPSTVIIFKNWRHIPCLLHKILKSVKESGKIVKLTCPIKNSKFEYIFFRNAYEVQALKDSIAEIKQNMDDKNLSKFENEVEVHMQHIQTGLSQMGNLRVFMMNSNNQSQHKIKVVPTVRVKMEKS